MATSARASRALVFMRHCRRPYPSQYIIAPVRQASSSPYSPTNFTDNSPPKSHTSAAAFEDESSSASASARAPFSQRFPVPRPVYAHPPARRFNVTEIPGSKLTPWTWLKSMFGWRPTPTYKPAPFLVNNNPYRARKKWPPDFRNLDPKQQFHYEKTYRRRAALKWARPTWNKSIKILQQSLVALTLIYFVFIGEPAQGQGTPFDGFRAWFFDKLSHLGQLPESTREEADKLREEAKKKFTTKVDTSNSPTAS